MISRNRGFVHLAASTAICVALWIVWSAPFVAAQSSWQAEWEKTLRTAEAEGQFTLYGCSYDYDRVLEVFRKRYPKATCR
jgi:1,2-phenylacetyl-CoA epoxidase PaaB subunit